MDDGDRVQLAYEAAGVGPPAGRVRAAVGVSVVFVGMALLMMAPGLPDRVRVAVVLPWVVTGLAAGVTVWRARGWVRQQGRRHDARATWWATVLLLVGLNLGLVGILVMPLQMTIHEGRPSMACASHMRQIGMAIVLYSNAHQGWYPDRLEGLILDGDVSADMFVCEMAGDDSARGPTTRAVADALTTGGHLSYVYVGAGLRTGCDTDTVVMYEPPANHHGAMNVLFADGHVALVGKADARELADRIAAGERPVVWMGKGAGSASKPAAGEGR